MHVNPGSGFAWPGLIGPQISLIRVPGFHISPTDPHISPASLTYPSPTSHISLTALRCHICSTDSTYIPHISDPTYPPQIPYTSHISDLAYPPQILQCNQPSLDADWLALAN